MPRRRRGLKDQTCYHLTHRCHKREFLFRFAKDRERLLRCLGRNPGQVDAFRDWYGLTLSDKLQRSYLAREPLWTEAFAVGDQDWVGAVHSEFGFTRKKILPANVSCGLILGDQPQSYYIED